MVIPPNAIAHVEEYPEAIAPEDICYIQKLAN
jgi:hypothetical protein